MPNGGSDCCGTCWFNRANKGRRGSLNHDRRIPSHCEIRNFAIENPGYTYCANHPYRCTNRDPVPIGPVLRHGAHVEVETESDSAYVQSLGDRSIWKLSPDTEQIRQHLLELLESFIETIRNDTYPFHGAPPAAAVLWQVGEFEEQRAVEHLRRISEFEMYLFPVIAEQSLEKIRNSRAKGDD